MLDSSSSPLCDPDTKDVSLQGKIAYCTTQALSFKWSDGDTEVNCVQFSKLFHPPKRCFFPSSKWASFVPPRQQIWHVLNSLASVQIIFTHREWWLHKMDSFSHIPQCRRFPIFTCLLPYAALFLLGRILLRTITDAFLILNPFTPITSNGFSIYFFSVSRFFITKSLRIFLSRYYCPPHGEQWFI